MPLLSESRLTPEGVLLKNMSEKAIARAVTGHEPNKNWLALQGYKQLVVLTQIAVALLSHRSKHSEENKED